MSRSRRRITVAVSVAALGLLIAALPRAAVARAAEKLQFKSVADFTKCVDGYQAAPETCLEVLDAFIKANPAQAFAAGKVVRAKMNHEAAMPFFARAFLKKGDKKGDNKGDKARCADPDVAMAVVGALGVPADSGTMVTDALAVLLDKCWAETQAPVLKALAEAGQSGYMADNLCPRLAERKVANPSCDKKPAAAAAPEVKWKDIDPKAMVIDGPVKVFRGAEGRALTMVKLKNEDAYLLKFDGFRGEWNGRVVLHREAPVNSGFDYFTQVKGARWVGVVVRDGGTEVYPSGDKGPFGVLYDEDASKKTSGQAVLDQLRKQKP